MSTTYATRFIYLLIIITINLDVANYDNITYYFKYGVRMRIRARRRKMANHTYIDSFDILCKCKLMHSEQQHHEVAGGRWISDAI